MQDGSAPDIARLPTPGGSNRHLRRLLDAIGTCADGCDWVGERDLRRAWMECPRGDWLLWAADVVGVDHHLSVRAAGRCIRDLVLAHAPPGDPRPRQAVIAALRWADHPTDERWEQAVDAAQQAREAASASPAAVARRVARLPAQLLRYPDGTLTNAADICVDIAAARDERRALLAAERRYAEIVRETIPFAVVAEAIAEMDRDGAAPGSLGEIGVEEARRRPGRCRRGRDGRMRAGESQ